MVLLLATAPCQMAGQPWCLTTVMFLSCVLAQDAGPVARLTTHDKIFSLGAPKTATTTTTTMLAWLLPRPSNIPNKTRCCHNMCPEAWNLNAIKHVAKGPLLDYNCFADNGDRSDVKWLLSTFKGSRYLLTVRGKASWSASFKNHIAAHRISKNCTAYGNHKDCHIRGMVDNTPEHIAARYNGIHQHNVKVAKYFSKTKEMMNRFLILNATHIIPREWWLTMAWLARADVTQFPTNKVIKCEDDLPDGFVPAALKMFEQRHINISHAPKVSHTLHLLQRFNKTNTSLAHKEFEELQHVIQDTT